MVQVPGSGPFEQFRTLDLDLNSGEGQTGSRANSTTRFAILTERLTELDDQRDVVRLVEFLAVPHGKALKTI